MLSGGPDRASGGPDGVSGYPDTDESVIAWL